MADTKEVTEETSGGLDERVGKLEAGQDTLTGKVDQILGILGSDKNKAHDAAEQRTEAKLDRPSNVADEIRQQLDERDRAAKADREKQAADGELADLKAKVAELSEKPPEPMPRRVETWMWGKR